MEQKESFFFYPKEILILDLMKSHVDEGIKEIAEKNGVKIGSYPRRCHKKAAIPAYFSGSLLLKQNSRGMGKVDVHFTIISS